MNADKQPTLNEITEKVIGCAYRVANGLGCVFLEKVYENAMAHELKKAGLRVEKQRGIEVLYDGVLVGNYCADLLVEEVVIVELKAVKTLDEIHTAQCLNYLRATNLKLCLLLNFGSPKLEIKRLANRF